MPTYVFECQDCQKEFELLLSFAQIASQPTICCPTCGGQNIQRVWTAPVMWTHGEHASSAGERAVSAGCSCNR
jgi:putative FmdB family regulatory protein